MVVIRDLPPLLEAGEYQLEVFTYQNGHVESDRSVVWTTSDPGATVDENHLLSVAQEGPLTITAALTDRPEIHTSVSTQVQLNQTNVPGVTGLGGDPVLYPNPASDYVRVKGGSNSSLLLFNASGKELIRVDHYQEETVLDISSFPQGIYLVQIDQGDSLKWFKLIKK
jgi:hypothetical protein